MYVCVCQRRGGLVWDARLLQYAASHTDLLLFVLVAPAFPFGHGLSYTTFQFTDLVATAHGIAVTVANNGSVTGMEVVQVYLGFPSSAGEPPLQVQRVTNAVVDEIYVNMQFQAFSCWGFPVDFGLASSQLCFCCILLRFTI